MRKPILSLRGLRVCALYCETKDQLALQRQFQRLGVDVAFLTEPIEHIPSSGFDIVMFDSDHAAVVNHGLTLIWPSLPTVAILGSETPSRMKWVLDQNVSGYLRKPVRFEGILSTCVLAIEQFQQQQAFNERIGQLEERVRARKFVISAQLKLMRERNISEFEAYTEMRSVAMRRQITVERLSVELLGAGVDCT